jgi:hypothetical protein
VIIFTGLIQITVRVVHGSYDWAYFKFGPDDTREESHLYPAQIWIFVDLLKPIEFSDDYGEGVKVYQSYGFVERSGA